MFLSGFGYGTYYLQNFLLLIGFILGSYQIYILSLRDDYNESKVLDWVLLSSLVGGVIVWLFSRFFPYQELLPQISFGNRMIVTWTDYSLGFFLLVFFLFSHFLLKFWRWDLRQPLIFWTVGSVFFLFWVEFFIFLPGDWLFFPDLFWGISLFSLLLRWVILFKCSSVSYWENKFFYLGLFLLFRPVFSLIGMTLYIMVEWKSWIGVVKKLFNFSMKKKTKNLSEKREENLKKEGGELQDRLEELQIEDPGERPERVSENAPEDDASEAEDGIRVAALRHMISRRLKDIKTALHKVKKGSYGFCDRCGAKISEERLKAKPDAHYCVSCARELEKNGRI